MFPAVGERVQLTQTRRLLAIQGKNASESPTSVHVKVNRILPRDLNASTAAILGTIVY